MLGTAAAAALTIFFCFKAVSWTFPVHSGTWGVYFWHMMQSFGWGLLTLVVMISVVFPLIFNACFARGFCNTMKQDGVSYAEEGFFQAIASSFWVFFRTLKWRILWPLLLLATVLFLPFLVFPLALLAANHLVIIESADLVLSLFGMESSSRVDWLKRHGTDCFAAAISGSFLSFLLGLVGVGWIFWVPALYCGTFIWIRSQNTR